MTAERFHSFFQDNDDVSAEPRFQIVRFAIAGIATIALILSACDRAGRREVDALTVRLQHALRHHEFAEAEKIARQILFRAPRNSEAWGAIVDTRLQISDLKGAEKTLENWRAADNKANTRLEEASGDVALAHHDQQSAILRWQKALGIDPWNERVLRKIAELEHERQHWVEEETAWSTLIKLRDSAELRLRRAVIRRRLHRWEDAISDLQTARSLAPQNPVVQDWWQRFERLEKVLDEIRELDININASPADSSLLGDRALVFLRAGEGELALTDAERAAKLAIWAVRPRLLQSIALLELNRPDECTHLFVRTSIRLAELTPESLETLRRLDGQISVERTNPELFISRAWQLNEIGQPALAQQDAQTAFTLDHKSAGALAEWSYASMKLGQVDEALNKIKLATDLDPHLATAWQYRGEIEMTRGETVSAIDSLSHALQLNQTAIALQKRAECYRKIGYDARAEEDLRALQDLTARAMR
jgi:tetratricopeptide (TPR) repeat protein